MKRFPRPLRRSRAYDFEVTEQGQREALPTTPLDIEVTPAGKGIYLHNQGKFNKGEDLRRHKFTELECSLGGHVAALNLLISYGDAYCDTEEEWEALAGQRMNTILALRVGFSPMHVSC